MSKPKAISVENYGIKNATVRYQLTPDELHQETIEKGLGKEASTGALAINTGKFTGRSPQDRFIVEDDITRDRVWWGKVNIKFDSKKFDALYDKVVNYLSEKEIYVHDGYVCADPKYKTNIRTVTELPWSNLFAYNMFLRIEDSELASFKEDWLVVNAPGFIADPAVDGTRQGNFAILNFGKKIALVGGTGYTGEIKKGIFSALNFELPVFRNTMPMHCSANVGKDGDTAIFFGLSGTGKTTLSADPNRHLIGDDEHGWTPENTVFNFEGGCYAKVVDLTAEKEPEIFKAIKKGAILENVIMNDKGEVDFTDTTITENTRVSYPIYHIDNIQPGSIGHNPKNIFFLTFDAYGVLPPISKLDPNQAAYQFISGYTSKVAGTEVGITTPQKTFSACFGSAFMPLHPAEYGKMLTEKIQQSGVNVWLVNTGYNGKFKRCSLKDTRALITAALTGELNNVAFKELPIFGFQVPQSCATVSDQSILNPENTWDNKADFAAKSKELAESFIENFKKFEEGANAELMKGAPKV
ncbi:MAG: phosphoenolpyruvate carboxykinase (ATP) [Capnocytophaga sp.]|nr:phosphoenolpyruvate carboxykinase (ATP) [Capnocytophaga sp.]